MDAADIAGQTPLHHAIAEGHGDTAFALLKAGAATDKKDTEGILAMDLAPDSAVSSEIQRTENRDRVLIFYRSRNSSYNPVNVRV